MGEDKPSLLGLDGLLHMAPSLTVGGVPLTKEEIRDLLSQSEGLSFIKGKWIAVDHERLRRLLDEMKKYDGDITLLDALRSEIKNVDDEEDVGPVITNGKWLGGLLKSLRNPRRNGFCSS